MVTDAPPPAHVGFLVLRRGVLHAGAWSLQNGLLARGYTITADGDFGEHTEAIVKTFQANEHLTVDGIAGYQTQRALVLTLSRIEENKHRVPLGSLEGVAGGESSFELAARNDTVPGGVDLGAFQRRVYGPPWRRVEVERALRVGYQARLLATQLRERFEVFYGRPGAKELPRAWRLALLAHNYPYGAHQIAAVGITGLPSYWTTPQAWVMASPRKFADGAPVETPLDWCRHYSLGAPEHHHVGLVAGAVRNWNVY